ncbi:MAG TPA: ribosome recycling factor [Candidatus Parcubacteria bacterium]|nr:ribosome recycling factor [Candidatus Parcubacteria bacterium]
MPEKEIVDYKHIVNKIKPELEKAVAFFEKELAKIRTGRATPALVEDISVECFGQRYPLKQLAAISIPEPRQIVIQPWDKSYIEGIVNALSSTGIGANPIVDKDLIRINLPPLTEEYRKTLVRLMAEKKEEARKTIRRWRNEAWEKIQEGFQEGQIREDDKFRGKDYLQEVIDEYQEKLDQLAERKEKEIEV